MSGSPSMRASSRVRTSPLRPGRRWWRSHRGPLWRPPNDDWRTPDCGRWVITSAWRPPGVPCATSPVLLPRAPRPHRRSPGPPRRIPTSARRRAAPGRLQRQHQARQLAAEATLASGRASQPDVQLHLKYHVLAPCAWCVVRGWSRAANSPPGMPNAGSSWLTASPTARACFPFRTEREQARAKSAAAFRAARRWCASPGPRVQ